MVQSHILSGGHKFYNPHVNSKASQPLVYKFNRKPIKVRILASVINNNITDQSVTLDLQWDDFIVILKTLFQKDIDIHESSVQV